MLPYRIEWSAAAQADVRRLDRSVAMQVFDVVLRFAQSGAGQVSPIHGELADYFRLRAGDYRILFKLDDDTVKILGVRHRSEAYR